MTKMIVKSTAGNNVEISQKVIDMLDELFNPNLRDALPSLKHSCFNINMFLAEQMCHGKCHTEDELKEQMTHVQDIYNIVQIMMKPYPDIKANNTMPTDGGV